MDLFEIGAGHPAFKELLRVRRGSVAAHESRVVAEGLWAVQLLLRLGTPIEQLFCCPELIYSDTARACAAAAAERARESFQVSGKSMHRIAERDTPEGLLAVVRMPHWPSAELRLGDAALIVVADGLENPGNLGTLLRTADGAGAELVVVTNRRTRISHPQVFRASHGMSLKVPHIEFAHPEDAFEWLRQHACTIYPRRPRRRRTLPATRLGRPYGAGIRQRAVRAGRGMGGAGVPPGRDSDARRGRLPERGGSGGDPECIRRAPTRTIGEIRDPIHPHT